MITRVVTIAAARGVARPRAGRRGRGARVVVAAAALAGLGLGLASGEGDRRGALAARSAPSVGPGCLASDGAHPGLVLAVGAALGGPAVEPLETRATPAGPDGRRRIMMAFRAGAGTGHVAVGLAHASYDPADCDDVELLALE